MKWTECKADNAAFTNNYDAGAREVRKVLGSFDHIAHLIFSETGQSVSGVSVRRWLKNRNLPINMACTIVDLVKAADKHTAVELRLFFPYLEDYFSGYLD